MKNQLIHLSKEEADRCAYDYFINICGFKNREGEKFERLLAHGMKIKEKIIDRIDMKAVVSSFDSDIISGNTAKVGDVLFTCNAFEQLEKQNICKIYIYLFTTGNFEPNDDEPVIDQLYADIWGTAYTDAGLELLKHKLKDDFDRNDGSENVEILDPFGPGFYGMDIDQIGSFFKVLDGDLVGVEARTNSLMVPLKSCAGFFVIMNDGSRLPSSDCKSCHADHRGCEYCQAVIKQNK